jgi:hypothetical protein
MTGWSATIFGRFLANSLVRELVIERLRKAGSEVQIVQTAGIDYEGVLFRVPPVAC